MVTHDRSSRIIFGWHYAHLLYSLSCVIRLKTYLFDILFSYKHIVSMFYVLWEYTLLSRLNYFSYQLGPSEKATPVHSFSS